MEVTMKFDLPEENETFKQFFGGPAYKAVLDDVAEKIFRPARKHGYSNPAIELLLEKLDDDGLNLISLLETIFYELLEEHEVKL